VEIYAQDVTKQLSALTANARKNIMDLSMIDALIAIGSIFTRKILNLLRDVKIVIRIAKGNYTKIFTIYVKTAT